MNTIKIHIAILFFILAILGTNAQVQIKLPYPTFEAPAMPAGMSVSEGNIWLIEHYWDKFNFSNPDNISNPRLASPIISGYIDVMFELPDDISIPHLQNLLQKAKANKEVYVYITKTLVDLLGNTISPYRNDEYLIPVLEDLIASRDSLFISDRSDYTMSLEMARKNRIQTIASNFGYIDTEGRSDSLYNIKAEYTLLMFYSPGCHACELAEDQIRNSKQINSAISNGSLKVLAFAPEAPVDVWKEFQKKLPSTWINAYDPQQIVWLKRIYDIQGFPTIYLLDKDKRVLLKDTSIRRIEEFLKL